METAGDLVYRGREGTGAAQIFGQPGNPMGVYYKRRGEEQQREAIAAEQARLAKEQRNKKMWDILNVEPEKAFYPFDDQVREAMVKHRAKFASYLDSGGDPDDLNFKNEVKNSLDEVNALARKSNHIKDVITKTQDSIEKSPYLQQEYYFPKIWDMYMDEHGKGKPLSDVNYEDIQNIHVSDPMGFNELKYQKDFNAGMNDVVTNYTTQKAANNGILTKDGETKWKGDVYTIDPNSPIGVKVDENGKPVINPTSMVVNSFLDSDTANRYYSKIAEQQGVDVRDIARNRVSGIETRANTSFSRTPTSLDDYYTASRFGLKPNQIPAATQRYRKITSIQNAVREDGTISPEAKASLGALRNAKYGDGVVLDVKVIPGSSDPGEISVFPGLQKIKNAPYDRVVFNVKNSDRGQNKVGEINLGDPGAFETINGMMETTPAEGKQTFSTDQLLGIQGVSADQTYKGSANAEKRAAIQKAEQETLTQLNEGQNYGQLAGKQLNGSPIVKVVKDSNLLGTFRGYKITTADGQEHTIEKGDIEGMRSLLKGGLGIRPEVKPAGTKSTGVNWE